MQIQTTPAHIHSITKYDNTGLEVNEQKYNHSVLITSQSLHPFEMSIKQVQELTVTNISLKEQVEILLIAGEALSPLSVDPQLYSQLFNQGISLEVMSLGGGCRTFNILLSEERPIAGLFLF